MTLNYRGEYTIIYLMVYTLQDNRGVYTSYGKKTQMKNIRLFRFFSYFIFSHVEFFPLYEKMLAIGLNLTQFFCVQHGLPLSLDTWIDRSID